MSRYSRVLELQNAIRALDARFDDGKRLSSSSFRSLRKHFLREIYLTGVIPRETHKFSLPTEVVMPPDELLAIQWPYDPSGIEIPDEVLFPKRGRGRPRNDSLLTDAALMQCSPRHARRLLALAKPRERGHGIPPDVIEALEAREQRAVLVLKLHSEEQSENVIEFIAVAIYLLRTRTNLSWEPERRIARRWVEEAGLVSPVLKLHAALGGGSFRNVEKLLGICRATLYRKYGRKLDHIRRCGSELLAFAVVDIAQIKNLKRPESGRGVVTRPESDWERQVSALSTVPA